MQVCERVHASERARGQWVRCSRGKEETRRAEILDQSLEGAAQSLHGVLPVANDKMQFLQKLGGTVWVLVPHPQRPSFCGQSEVLGSPDRQVQMEWVQRQETGLLLTRGVLSRAWGWVG